MNSQEYEEIDLFELLEVLALKWKLIVAITIVTTVFAAAFTLLTPAKYKSGFALLVDDAMPLPAYETLLENQAYLIVDKLPPTDEAPTARQILESSSISTNEEAGLISLSISTKDSTQAYSLASLWLESFMNESKRLLTQEPENLVVVAQNNLIDLHESYNQLVAEQNILEADRSLLSKELENVEGRVLSYENRLAAIDIQLASETEQLATVRKQIQGHDPIIRLMTPVFSTAQGSFKLLEQEQLNPIYTDLSRKEITLSNSISALTAEQKKVVDSMEMARSRYAALRDQVVSLKNRLAELDDLITNKASQVKYWNNELHQASSELELLNARPLILVGEVVKPEGREARGLMLNVTIAALLGLFVGALGALFGYFRTERKKNGLAA